MRQPDRTDAAARTHRVAKPAFRAVIVQVPGGSSEKSYCPFRRSRRPWIAAS